jgi:hypothetical protein
VIRD